MPAFWVARPGACCCKDNRTCLAVWRRYSPGLAFRRSLCRLERDGRRRRCRGGGRIGLRPRSRATPMCCGPTREPSPFLVGPWWVPGGAPASLLDEAVGAVPIRRRLSSGRYSIRTAAIWQRSTTTIARRRRPPALLHNGPAARRELLCLVPGLRRGARGNGEKSAHGAPMFSDPAARSGRPRPFSGRPARLDCFAGSRRRVLLGWIRWRRLSPWRGSKSAWVPLDEESASLLANHYAAWKFLFPYFEGLPGLGKTEFQALAAFAGAAAKSGRPSGTRSGNMALDGGANRARHSGRIAGPCRGRPLVPAGLGGASRDGLRCPRPDVLRKMAGGGPDVEKAVTGMLRLSGDRLLASTG